MEQGERWLSLAIFFSFYRIDFRGRCDSYESHLPLIWTIYFPTAPFFLFWEENKLTFALFRVKVLLNRGGRASSFIYLLYRELQEVGVQHDRGEANGLLRAS